MTNKEAIEIIRSYNVFGCGYCHEGGDEIPEAFQMAVDSLNRPSGIVIKGVKMPKGCYECFCAYFTEGVAHDYCQAVGYETNIEEYGYRTDPKGRPDWCPLVEVK